MAGNGKARPAPAIARALAAIACGGLVLAGVELAFADGYFVPRAPQCSAAAPIRLAEAGNCLSIDGGTGLDYGKADRFGDIRLDAGRLDFTGAADIGLGRLAGAFRLSTDPAVWAYQGPDVPRFGLLSPQSAYRPAAGFMPAASWNVEAGHERIDAAYLAASAGSSLVAAGLVDRSVANTADDRPYSPLPALSDMAGASGVNLPGAPELAGAALQFVQDLGGGGLIGLGLEDLQSAGTAIASWSYATGFGSGHITLLDPDIVAGRLDRLGFHTGATIHASPFDFRAALAGDRSGWVDGLASSQATFGVLRLAASGQYLRDSTVPGDPARFGGGVSASAALADELAVNAAINWVHDTADQGDDTHYQLGLALTTPLSDGVELSGQLGLAGGSASLVAAPFGQTQISLEPDDNGSALSAAVSAHADGSYSVKTVASRSFD